MSATAIEQFEAQRGALFGLAYRMLGSRTEAEDVVQDTWLRWRETDPDAITDTRAWLLRVASNVCLDRLKAARVRREVYVGSWLPEPLLDAAIGASPLPEAAAEFADDVSVALLIALDRLSPAERAAFLLHDVFGCGFDEIAGMLARSEAACRQLARRARGHVRAARPRHACPPAQARALARAFAAAVESGDVDGLAALLARDCSFISDGGGQVAAVPRPVFGDVRVAKVVVGFARGYQGTIVASEATINGLAGFVVSDECGRVIQTVALEPNVDTRIQAIYVVRNPDKLRHVRPVPAG